MDLVSLIAFAFPVGLTACGLVGTAMEMAGGRRLAFVEPYVSPRHVLRSLAAVAVGGPFMLMNDALAARRARRISLGLLVSCGCTALAWALALGVTVLSGLLRASGIA
ncbi:MAG: hypothetical protein J0I98_17160 [Mesorhizobium sp.]|nr:hypothetical protein [Mesorhizobium sp.]MBN9244517.1 hypothetical protein [Mesorhizobium sp.]MBN9270342.1 hypothetical protein [Mesorhizobium sp.]